MIGENDARLCKLVEKTKAAINKCMDLKFGEFSAAALFHCYVFSNKIHLCTA